ncbi:hypothetical protein BH10PSE13_BH10PSE13_00130 [soil metagenome]
MDLRTFISEALTQIVAGVLDAQQSIDALNSNARINPKRVGAGAENPHADPTPVEFDVALTISQQTTEGSNEKTGGNVQGGILNVFSAKIETEMGDARSGSSNNETVSRVKFSVQLAQPAHITERRERSVNVPSSRTAWNG